MTIQDQTPDETLSEELQSAVNDAIEDAANRIEDAIWTLEQLHDELADDVDNDEASNLLDQVSIILDDLNNARERMAGSRRRYGAWQLKPRNG